MDAHRALFETPSGSVPNLGAHADLVTHVTVMATTRAADPTTLILALATIFFAAGHAIWRAQQPGSPARRVGDYVLGELIGSGGMGEVWSARHPSIQGEVAVKILRRDRSLPGPIARLKREIQALRRLSHPNTIRVIDGGSTGDGVWYLAMELVRGDNLKQLVQREGPLSPARAIAVVRQVAGALAEAHALGIIHRDLKPENILIRREEDGSDSVKVLDFGIAKHRPNGTDITALTHADMIVGTPAYMSPEQAASRDVDARADIYSLGAVLFYALTGRPPFEGTTGMLLLYHLAKKPPLASTLAPGFLPAQLDMVVQRCLAKAPTGRYTSMQELDEALSWIDPTPGEEVTKGGSPDVYSVRIVDVDEGVRPGGLAATAEGPPLVPEQAA